MPSKVDIGFIETPEFPWLLCPEYFPSKLGGKPAWLDPERLPLSKFMLCESCCKPMVFLLQLYAPNEDSIAGFHRTIYVFCCKNDMCYLQQDNHPFLVLRCNLPRENPYYNIEPPDYDSPINLKMNSKNENLCQVCGCQGSKTCSQCKSVKYCGKDHQVIDWKRHKLICNKEGKEVTDKTLNHNFKDILFPEHEIATEPEEIDEVGSDPVADDTLSQLAIDCNSKEYADEDLENAAVSIKEDTAFIKFKKRVSYHPDQVVRYQKEGSPLWCSNVFIPTSKDIPPCECGAPRLFEFQVMPHLLSYMKVDTSITEQTIDWGIIAIYTCSKDCSPDKADASAYIREFAWKQNYTSTNFAPNAT